MAIYLLFYTKWNYWVKSVLVFIALLLSFSIFHFFSIPNLLAFILVIPLLLYFNIKSKLKNYVSLFLIVIIPLTIYNSDFITNKLIANKNIAQLKRFVKDPISFSPELGEQKSRSMINFCSLELIKTAPFIGYGIGDAKDELITCYEDSDFIEGVLYEYNSHNYYLKLIISGGIILFLSFLYLLISNFVIAIKLEKWLYISFIVIIGVNLLSENILGRAHGILFFALFNSLFYKKHLLYTSKK
ncbi:O-antigen ligase family protein [Aurantibacter sp.]|uniref:O-antigen ligase family protein n=1 Tax=Aurantibacter sp. TaxID=2807103 RepID=UPI0035C82178